MALVAGAAGFCAMAGAGVAFAVGGPSHASVTASNGSTSTTQPAKGGPRGFPGIRRGFSLGGPFGAIGGSVVHGSYTFKSGSGYKTILTQTGTVASVSSSAITVTSSDGFKQTFSVESTTIVDSQSGGISAVSKGDSVDVQGELQSGKRVATDIVDTTKVGASRKAFGLGSGGFRPQAPGQGPLAPPTSPPSTSGPGTSSFSGEASLS